MDELENKFTAILNNPQLMQQIMAMANSIGASAPPQKQESPPPSLPEIDPSMIQKIAALSSQGGIDREQQALLKALTPYLNRERISRLERAMKAARTARLASGLLGQNGIPFLSGR